MANLAELVEALMEQVASAQAAADARAAAMQGRYAADPAMSHLKAPRPVIDGVSIDLKVAFRTARATVVLREEQRSDLLRRLAADTRGAAADPSIASRLSRSQGLRRRWEQALPQLDARVASMIPANTTIDPAALSADMAALVAGTLASILDVSSSPEALEDTLRELAKQLEADLARALYGAGSAGELGTSAQRKLSRVLWDVPFQRSVAELFEAQADLVGAWDQQADALLDCVQAGLLHPTQGAADAVARAAGEIVSAVRELLSSRSVTPADAGVESELRRLSEPLRQAMLRSFQAVAGAPSGRAGMYEVIVSSDELASIPESQISTLKIAICQPGAPRDDGR